MRYKINTKICWSQDDSIILLEFINIQNLNYKKWSDFLQFEISVWLNNYLHTHLIENSEKYKKLEKIKSFINLKS